MKTKQKDYTTYYLFTDVEGIGLNFDKDGKVLKNDLIEISYILSDENLFQMKRIRSLFVSYKKTWRLLIDPF